MILFFLLLFFYSNSFSQKNIDSSNYYDYYSTGKNIIGKKLTTAWLTELEIASILRQEMNNAGFEWLINYPIIKIDSIQYLTSICYSRKSNFGFLYEPIHSAIPNKKERSYKSMYKEMMENDYSIAIIGIDGKTTFSAIKEVPNNLFIMKENNYWYQLTDNINDNDLLVTKEDIIKILRSDIQSVLNKVKK